MAEDKPTLEDRLRSRGAIDHDTEVRYLIERTGITAEEALDLVELHGNDRVKLLEEAQRLKRI